MATKKKTMAPTTATVHRTIKDRVLGEQSSQTDVTIEVNTFATDPARVQVGYGTTLNLGNFESARVDVLVSVPCYKEEIDDAFVAAKKWVEEKVAAEIHEIRSGTTKKQLF